MSRPRPRPAPSATGARRHGSNNSSSQGTLAESTQEGSAFTAASPTSLQSLSTSQQSPGPRRSSTASQTPAYRTPHQQQWTEGRTSRGGRRRGPVQEPPRHPAFQSAALASSPPAVIRGEHSQRAESPVRNVQPTAPVAYEQPLHQHYYVSPPTALAYPTVDPSTGTQVPPISSLPPSRVPSHTATVSSELPVSPDQPLVTQTEEGLTYYTYGPFASVPRGPTVPTTRYVPPMQPGQAVSGPYPVIPAAVFPTGQVAAASYSRGRPALWPQLAPQAPGLAPFPPPAASATRQGSWRSGRGRGASHPPRPLTVSSPPLPPSREPPFTAPRPAPGAGPRSRSATQATHSSQGSSTLPSSQLLGAGGIASPDSGSEQQSAATRSEHVMWVGNVPANTTQEELQSFFASRLSRSSRGSTTPDATGGIVSIFIITRSNCAFINFASAELLEKAVKRFNGVTYRSPDGKGTKLVCRVRKKEEEAQSGVAGQRGKHIHVAWLKEHNRRRRAEEGAGSGSSDPISQGPETRSDSSAADISVGDPPSESAVSSDGSVSLAGEGGSVSSSSAEVSYASTNSDMLRHPAFRKRFFILKSLNVEELDNAVQTGMWSTQPHNEKVLDQAYRTSEDVILIFSANQSGNFFGYARMASPISSKPQGGQVAEKAEAISTEPQTPKAESPSVASSSESKSASVIFSPDAVNDSPEPVLSKEGSSTSAEANVFVSTASDLEGDGTSTPTGRRESDLSRASARHSSQSQPSALSHQEEPRGMSSTMSSLGDGVVRRDMASAGMLAKEKERVAATADAAATAEPAPSLSPGDSVSADAVTEEESLKTRAMIHNMRLESDAMREAESGPSRTKAPTADHSRSQGSKASELTSLSPQSEPLGPRFAIQWLETRPLPFSAVKHLRNAWNENRSIRVARDGTEVAIDTGLELCAAWERFVGTA